jgi:multicomponent Na+:H+ antiporter subunit E
MIGQVILRLTIWFLLTANFGVTNIIIGLLIAFLLPRGYPSRVSLGTWFQMAVKVLKAVPRAYLEALEMMFRPHNREDIVREPVPPRRTPGLIFLDIFLITFTPKTIVLKYDEGGWYDVHRVRRGPRDR